MWDYDALTALGADYAPNAVLLSGQTVVLALAALATMENRGGWESDGLPLDTAQEDDRDIIVSQAVYEITSGSLNVVYAGTIMQYAGSTVPSGWVECDGAVKLRADYAPLFAAIGTIWNLGGEPSNSFRLPDLRGRTPIGTGTGTGLTNRVLGAIGGEETHILTIAEMPAHNHNLVVSGGSGTNSRFTPTSGTWQQSSALMQNTGGGGGHENMQPFSVLKFIIATGE